jgi:hypothetical protein
MPIFKPQTKVLGKRRFLWLILLLFIGTWPIMYFGLIMKQLTFDPGKFTTEYLKIFFTSIVLYLLLKLYSYKMDNYNVSLNKTNALKVAMDQIESFCKNLKVSKSNFDFFTFLQNLKYLHVEHYFRDELSFIDAFINDKGRDQDDEKRLLENLKRIKEKLQEISKDEKI